ncbi:MAG: Asp-tRNA(Asn)/Glu-tRNA(Gln) amidotransferase subunit GatB [Phycisphaerae bacterium]|nr:Asp-tRNA(Asn)/Glu-tRNA(Gln) amidotransferase subunit GatB [Phycisphaerae bacterium]
MARIVSTRLTIGMEVHVELSTRSKMFSRAPNPACREFDASPPNSLIDPTVLGLPGALPVMNRSAVELSILVGLALGCRIADAAVWDRKGYFYPDLPKGYQISQYALPLCGQGRLDVPALDDRGRVDLDAPTHTVRIRRAHLEEDAGKLLHEAPGGGPIDGSIIDLNRAGTPLLEIVTEPDFTTAEQAVSFARMLRDICRFVGATEGVMQKGHMRFEPNINSVLTLDDGREVATPIVEIKNLNSFKSLRGAIEHEAAAQPARWEADGLTLAPGTKRTLGWDDARGITLPQREKEEAHDYRYFPDPDLPPVVIDAAWREAIAARLPELPLSRHRRYVTSLGLSAQEAAALSEERATSDLFEEAMAAAIASGLAQDRAARATANVLLQSGLKRANERGIAVHDLGLHPAEIAELGSLRERGLLGSNAADELFGLLADRPCASGPRSVESLARERSLLTLRDDAALDAWCRAAIAAHPKAADDVRAGKPAAIGRLVGEAMKASAGRGDAAAIRQRLASLLSG